MNQVFADAGFFVALLSLRDQHKESANQAVEAFKNEHLVTTEMVLVEVFAAISREGERSRAGAIQYLKRLRNDPNVTIIPQTSQQFDAATQLFAQRLDQRYSLTDCASFLVMEERGISQALTFDTDFRAAGFGATLA